MIYDLRFTTYLRWLVVTILIVGGATTRAKAQLAPADDFFHGGARHYLSNNIPAALQSVTNGLQLYPDDEKLKKLYELLNQQQQQQQDQKQDKQDEQNQDQKQDQQKQDEKKDQQSKGDQEKKEDDKKSQDKRDQDSSKPDEKKEGEKSQQAEVRQMTPQEAKQLLDAQKDDEKVLLFKPETDTKRQDKKLKDW